jgi:hypothetical protein
MLLYFVKGFRSMPDELLSVLSGPPDIERPWMSPVMLDPLAQDNPCWGIPLQVTDGESLKR